MKTDMADMDVKPQNDMKNKENRYGEKPQNDMKNRYGRYGINTDMADMTDMDV